MLRYKQTAITRVEPPTVSLRYFALSLLIATLLSLVVLARIMSSLGGDGSAAAAWIAASSIAVGILPWFLIFFGARRRHLIEKIGWTTLIILSLAALLCP